MFHSFQIPDNWQLFQRPASAHGPLSPGDVRHYQQAALSARGLAVPSMPMQVHRVLEHHGKLTAPRFDGDQQEVAWVAQSDWIYAWHGEISGSADGPTHWQLLCEGLDTVVDIWCNGRLVAEHRNCYLPCKTDLPAAVTGPEKMVLLLHFHAPQPYVEREMEQRLTANDRAHGVRARQLLRKPRQDFTPFLGPVAVSVGPYAPIRRQGQALQEAAVQTTYTGPDRTGTVSVEVEGCGAGTLHLRIVDAGGCVVGEKREELSVNGSQGWAHRIELQVEDPALWFPRGFGPRNLYTVCLLLETQGREVGRREWQTGFRELRATGEFAFEINQIPLRLWGVNIPPARPGHVWDRTAMERILDLAELSHANILRLWGPGQPCDNAHFLAEADRRGFLVWMEFAQDFFPTPEEENYRKECVAEAEWLVTQNRHHPSVLLWSGGNECYLRLDGAATGELEALQTQTGRELFEEELADVVRRLDPDRVYHPQSPSGGPFANSPEAGDTHCYNDLCVVPGIDFPIMVTEHFRAAFPRAESLREILGPEDAWPDGFQSRFRGNDGQGLVPPTWQKMGMNGSIKNYMLGPIGDFYDHADTLEGLIDRLNAGSMKYLRTTVERFRRGWTGTVGARGERRTRGHLWWKFHNTFPLLRNAVVDSLLEPNAVFYALRRAHAPLLISFEMDDDERIRVWLVNDTGGAVRGTLKLERRDELGRHALNMESVDVHLPHDASQPVFDCSTWHSIFRNSVLSAVLTDPEGQELARANWVPGPEVICNLGEPRLEFQTADDGSIFLQTDTYARRVTLTATSPEGEWSRWDFEDNYFDLLPDERKPVTWRGTHRQGTLRALCAGDGTPVTFNIPHK
jgi:hypothetical protein